MKLLIINSNDFDIAFHFKLKFQSLSCFLLIKPRVIKFIIGGVGEDFIFSILQFY